ncbi:MAG: hypothetical protein Q8N44_17375 [Rubrivivax sp.]|nr:hypothetical protein [Rubrivivax sp.]MDP3085443.1 hypothetical protein [Rubrivivax sp.]
MQPNTPRHYVSSPALPGVGLPHDRMARLAARQAFVELKRDFMDAVAKLPPPSGDWLRQQVRGAEEPTDLWLLRGPVFGALAGICPVKRSQRQLLRRGLDALFLDSGPASGFSPF